MVHRLNGNSIGKLTTVKVGRYDFVSAEQFCQIFDLGYSKNEQLKQLIIDVPNGPITITAINPFISIGNKIKQMPTHVLYHHGDFFLPIVFFLEIIQPVVPYKFEYDINNSELMVSGSEANVRGVIIEEKANGILFRIKTNENFLTSNIFTSESNNWFYVDFYGGRVDTLRPFPVENNGKKVRTVIPIQLSAETCRISFHLFSTILEKSVIIDKSSGDVLVSIKTNEQISDDLLTELEKEREKWKIDTIVIDPGHGGRDPGAVGRAKLYEKNITLAIALELKNELEKYSDVNVLLTRDHDKHVPVKKRTKYANEQGGKLFISIHVDSNPVKSVSGHTVYFLGPAKTEAARKAAQYENSVIKYEDSQNEYAGMSEAAFILAANAQNSYNLESQDFAAILDKELKERCNSKSHGVRQAGFYVLYGASMPNVLVETAFITNWRDANKLKSRSFYKSVARAISSGIIQFKKKYENL